MKFTLKLLNMVADTIRNYTNVLSEVSPEVSQALIGQLLSDGSASKPGVKRNARITWSFGHKFEEYAKFIASIFSAYINAGVASVKVQAKAGGRFYTSYRIKTVSLVVFNRFFDMFYVLNTKTNKYVKVVPTMIMELMTPIVLAHLIMGDGNYNLESSRVRIYTNSFSYEDCVRLAASITNMNIVTKVIKDKVNSKGVQSHILAIGKGELEKLRTMVLPHMHKSMLYRIGL